MAKVELTRDAERDLIDIYVYGVEHFGRPAAERYAEALAVKAQTAAENPSFGADYGFTRPGLRRYECVSHTIYYRATAEASSSCASCTGAWIQGDIWHDGRPVGRSASRQPAQP